MTYSKLQEVVHKYDLALRAHLIEKDSVCRLCHVCWMLSEIQTWNCINTFCADHLNKAMRWLGFIQGVLFCEDIYTIDEMREHNRE